MASLLLSLSGADVAKCPVWRLGWCLVPAYMEQKQYTDICVHADISVSLPLDERRTRDAQNVTTMQKASLCLSLSVSLSSSIDQLLELHPIHRTHSAVYL